VGASPPHAVKRVTASNKAAARAARVRVISLASR
jgi:hypothetical protein